MLFHSSSTRACVRFDDDGDDDDDVEPGVLVSSLLGFGQPKIRRLMKWV